MQRSRDPWDLFIGLITGNLLKIGKELPRCRTRFRRNIDELSAGNSALQSESTGLAVFWSYISAHVFPLTPTSAELNSLRNRNMGISMVSTIARIAFLSLPLILSTTTARLRADETNPPPLPESAWHHPAHNHFMPPAGLEAESGYWHSPGYWQPGGYESRIGSPYYYSSPHIVHEPYSYRIERYLPHHAAPIVIPLDPYTDNFGPGYYRHYEHSHTRFPYYSYRRPWYFPGSPSFNADFRDGVTD